MSITEKSASKASPKNEIKTRARDESRQPDFVVRAKTGPGRKDWSTLGYAWRRERGEGFSVKLNTMPIGSDWNGVLKLLPPFEEDGDDDPSSR
jgi:hypothetical protein